MIDCTYLILTSSIHLKGDYKQLRGMYPTVAGKVASNGPYSKVSDVYKIDGLTGEIQRGRFLFLRNMILITG